MPFASSLDNAQQAIDQLTHAIKTPVRASPFQLGDTQLNAIKILTELFHKKMKAKEIPLPLPPKVIQQHQSSPTPTPASSHLQPITTLIALLT